MSVDLGSWLQALGLDQYAEVFSDNGVDSAMAGEISFWSTVACRIATFRSVWMTAFVQEAAIFRILRRAAGVCPNRTLMIAARKGLSQLLQQRLRFLQEGQIQRLECDLNEAYSQRPRRMGRMADEGERRLAAILSADVSGYSKLMGDDERATVRTLTDYRSVFSEHIERHKGRVVDTAGDSVLAVFNSVVEAVQCAVNVQSELATRNSALAEERRMHFRVGINLGDVIEQDDGTIYGDGVKYRGQAGESGTARRHHCLGHRVRPRREQAAGCIRIYR